MLSNFQISLVRESWEAVYKIQDAAGPLFYNRLFEIAPEVRPLFNRTNVQEQSKKLFQMLHYVMMKLDRVDELTGEVASLAQRHVKYGVNEDHYKIVGEALLWTLEKGLGEKWNTATKDAWTTTYVILSSAMIKSAKTTAVK